MTSSLLVRWAALLAFVSAPIACGVERAVVATLDSAGAPGAQSGGDAGDTAAPAGQFPTLPVGGTGGAASAAPTVSAGVGGDSGGATTSGAGGASDLERAASGRGGADGRDADCLNVIERTSSGGGDTGAVNMACACLHQAPILLCGTDGVTYDAMCGDGCPEVEIACLHECPCDGAEAGPSTMTLWFPLDSKRRSECAAGFACIGFSSQTGALESSCITVPTDA